MADRLSLVGWLHDMETLSALLAPCYRNPPVTGGFPAQKDDKAELWYLIYGIPN